jgi:hypothetical protein
MNIVMNTAGNMRAGISDDKLLYEFNFVEIGILI